MGVVLVLPPLPFFPTLTLVALVCFLALPLVTLPLGEPLLLMALGALFLGFRHSTSPIS